MLFGSSSGAFTYNFAVDTADGIACYQTTSGFQVDATKAIGMHVLGDLTGNEAVSYTHLFILMPMVHIPVGLREVQKLL